MNRIIQFFRYLVSRERSSFLTDAMEKENIFKETISTIFEKNTPEIERDKRDQ